jgi:hypothetical protein
VEQGLEVERAQPVNDEEATGCGDVVLAVREGKALEGVASVRTARIGPVGGTAGQETR